MIYSFSNTTSYSSFYVFFSSFRITLWPMWLSNSKRQPCFHPPYSHTHKKTHKTDPKKTENLMGYLFCVRENSVQFFVQFFTVKLHSLLRVYSALNTYASRRISSGCRLYIAKRGECILYRKNRLP